MIASIIAEIKGQFANDTSGHDWFHILRVHKMACYLQEKEGGDLEIIELASLLHDISDHKMNGGIFNDGGNVARKILHKHNYDPLKTEAVVSIIDAVSFKGALVKDKMDSLEGKIVQDADRLDAIGAMGIARAFAYGGHKNRPMYQPDILPEQHEDFLTYAKSEGHTINHFYEKLLLLKDRLNTESARKIGQKRHDFMETFLAQFYKEWNTETE
ncbi:MAG: HD domain-containing protein [Bacteroidota bacterium]